MKRGKLIIIVAPSGTGKSSLIAKLRERITSLEWSLSSTTRPQRAGEKNFVDYEFIDIQEFEKRIEAGEFIEWARVHSNYYGTNKKVVDKALTEGKHLLFDIDVQGVDSMIKAYADEARVIFIEPPSIAVLEQRLLGRATDSEDVIKERINNAQKELLRKDDFEFKVTNDKFDKALDELTSVVKSIILE